MKRRQVFKTLGVGTFAVATASLPLTTQASGGCIHFNTDIGSNHGHALELDMIQVLELLNATQNGVTTTLDIQGQSGHPHSLELDQEMLVTLLATKQFDAESTVVAGHSHSVSITLTV